MKNLTLPIYTLDGKTNGSVDLDPSVFGVDPNPTLVHQALRSLLANRRATTAHTKDRSDVRGGGKKPWRQKGTGNARAGSIRSPLWRGGGVTFGPSNVRNYTQRLPQKMRQGAYKSVLSTKAVHDQIIILESLDAINGKTRSWIEASKRIPSALNSKLIVSRVKKDEADRAIRNIPNDKYIPLEGLTLYDLLRYSFLVITPDALEALTARLTSKKNKEMNKKETLEVAV